MKKKPYQIDRKGGFFVRELLHRRNSSWYDINLGIWVGWRIYKKGRI
jgi:hypothetical protein